MLDIAQNFAHEAFNENPHELIIVEDVTEPERTLGQLVRVLLDGESMLAEAVHAVFGVVNHIGRCVRTQEVVYGLRLRRDLLAPDAPMTSRVFRTA